MQPAQNDNGEDEITLCTRAVDGDGAALNSLITRYRKPLARMIRVRLPDKLQARIDDSDIIQEACVEASRNIASYEPDPERPFFLWLRQIALNKLIEAQRRHLGAKKRDANRDVPLPDPEDSSSAVAEYLVGSITSPSQAAIRAETKLSLERRLAEMDEVDREVLILRHFEHLSMSETAAILDISKSAVGKRYLKALDRLRDVLLQISEASVFK